MSKCRSSQKKIDKLQLICGATYAAIAFVVRLYCKSPYEFLYKIDEGDLFSPFWLFSILHIAAFFAGGCYLGYIICKAVKKSLCAEEVANIYRGGILFAVLFFMSLMWYPTLFLQISVIPAFFIAAICLILCASLIGVWSRVKGMGILWGIAFLLWWMYVTVLNFILIFKI